MSDSLRGNLSLDTCLGAITTVSRATADLAEGHFERPVTSCPGWTVRDAIAHLVEVHAFWATVVERRAREEPSLEAPVVEDGALLATYRRGADHLVDVLGAADQSAPVWTWAPTQQDVAFISRHQVQEALVHGWDVAHAVGAAWSIAPDLADDAVEEFLSVSMSREDGWTKSAAAPLDGVVTLRGAESGAQWSVRDGATAGTIVHRPGPAEGAVVLEAPSGDLLLWLFGRIDLPAPRADAEVLARLRALAFTE